MERFEGVIEASGRPDVLADEGAPAAVVRGVAPQSAGCGCGGAGPAAGGGDVGAKSLRLRPGARGSEPRFPSLAVEKEFAQATGRAGTAGLSDRQAVHAVLNERPNRYLARRLCWVLTIEGMETYLLQPRDPADFDLLVESVRPAPRATDVDVVIGVLGPIAPPTVCNGLMVPIVAFDQLYSFDVDGLVKSIPRPEKVDPKQFEPVAEEVFSRMIQIADNAGATDEDRALNYLAVRYPAIYASAAASFGRNESMSAVEVRPSALGAFA